MPKCSKPDEIREQINAVHQSLVVLEARAGIAEAAERLRTEPPSYIGVYDAAEPYSNERRELVAAEENFHQQRTTRRLRELYFTVHDAESARS